MPEKSITLISKECEINNKPVECLVAIFKPPLPKDIPFREEPDGHPPLEVVRTEEGDIRGIVYGRGIFGWSDSERESDFVKYWQQRGAKLGYEVPKASVHKVGAKVVESQVTVSA